MHHSNMILNAISRCPLKSEEGNAIDHFLVCGEDYKTIRDALATVLMEGRVDVLDKAYEVT